jgi:transcriptional regulator with XRE-family HTH domain
MTGRFSGDKLRALRLDRGLTQAELAHRAHVRERQIIRWENEQHVPRADAVARLARVLKTPLASLFSGVEENEDEDEEGDGVLVPVRLMIDYDLLAAAIERRTKAAA